MPRKVLVVEDEPALANTMLAYLEREGYDAQVVADGALAMASFNAMKPDIVLLDLMLPNIDGLSLCREIRQQSNVPIIMLTARVDEIDRLIGLEVGADDYVCKPYSPREVLARIKAVLKRYYALPDSEVNDHDDHQLVQKKLLHIDDAAMDAFWNGKALKLTAIEFRLLKALSNAPGRVFNRDQLMSHIYADNRIVSDRTVDSHVTKLRRKLNQLNGGQEVISSMYGVGYKFELPK